METPKKKSGKKAKVDYDQHGPWEVQTHLPWREFCAAIAENMQCTATSLDIDSFSWRTKATGAGTNVRNDFGYQQMVSRIRLLPPNPVPNVYLIMNQPRASGRRLVSLGAVTLFVCMC